MLAWIYSRARGNPFYRTVVDLGGGVGMIRCPECCASGWWAYMEPEIPGDYCVDCKGTGFRNIAFWPSAT